MLGVSGVDQHGRAVPPLITPITTHANDKTRGQRSRFANAKSQAVAIAQVLGSKTEQQQQQAAAQLISSRRRRSSMHNVVRLDSV